MASNGRIPLSQLRRVEHVVGGVHYLRSDASKALDRLALIANSQGHGTLITDSYRSYATQVRLRRDWCNRGSCNYAATPGTSNHGWGLAVDAADSRSDGLARWFHANEKTANEHGWHWPHWARPPGVIERWHWEYSSGLDRHHNENPNNEELTVADVDKIMSKLGNMHNGIGEARKAAQKAVALVEAVQAQVAAERASRVGMERRFGAELDELRRQARRALAAAGYPPDKIPGFHTVVEDGVDPDTLPIAVLAASVDDVKQMVRAATEPQDRAEQSGGQHRNQAADVQ